MHSPYSDGELLHPYQAGAAHTHHVPHVLPPSVGYLHPVKISAFHRNVPYNKQPKPSGLLTEEDGKERGGDE